MYEKIKNDIIAAMKSKDTLVLDTLRLLKGAIQLEEINKKDITDDLVFTIISKQIKMRKDSIIEFEKASRSEAVDKLNSEIEVLMKYLPVQLTDEELNNIIDITIKEVNATSISDFGNVMKELVPKIKGKSDTSKVSDIVKSKLK